MEYSLDPFCEEDEEVDWEVVLSSKREIRDPFESVAEPQPVDMTTVICDRDRIFGILGRGIKVGF